MRLNAVFCEDIQPQYVIIFLFYMKHSLSLIEATTKSDFRYGRTNDTLERYKKRTNIDFSMIMFSNNKL